MMEKMNWKTRYILFGGLIGMITGLVAAYIVVQKAEKKEAKPQLSPGEGVKIGLGVLGLLRLVSDISENK